MNDENKNQKVQNKNIVQTIKWIKKSKDKNKSHL